MGLGPASVGCLAGDNMALLIPGCVVTRGKERQSTGMELERIRTNISPPSLATLRKAWIDV